MTTVTDPELGKDLHATLQARRDLGPEYESALIDSFLEKAAQRLDSQIESRVRRELAQARVAGARVALRGGGPQEGEGRGRRFGLAAFSLVVAIPLSGIVVDTGHLPGLLLTWAGIVAVNLAHAWSTRSHEPVGRRPASADGWE